ncbi:hypothetical protein I4U23_005168 [Adineta vaga]|nr:hypothetical protein I4U23_005168 [Adineta vaga]
MNEQIPLLEKNTNSNVHKNTEHRHLSQIDWAEASWIRWWRVACFMWVIPILRLGYKQPLTDDDLDDLPNKDKSRLLLNEFNIYDWTITNIWYVITKTFWKDFLFSGILLIPYMAMRLVQPLLLRQIFLFIVNDQPFSSSEYFYIIVLFICSIIPPFIFQQSSFRIIRLGLRIRNALTSLIYARLLSTNAAALQQINTGHIINLVTNDTAKFSDSSIYLHFIWEGPLEAIVAFVFLCRIIGLFPTLCGYFVLLLLIPFQILFSRKLSQYYERVTKLTDKRLQAFDELINGCHVIKMYNWEEPIQNRIYALRKDESAGFRQAARLRAYNMSLFFSFLPLILLITFSSSWLFGQPLNAIDLFTAASIYAVIRSPLLSFFPIALEKLIQTKIAMKRIDTFIQLQQINQQLFLSSKIDDQQQKGRIVMQNASFSWQDKMICLSSIDIDIKPGSLVSIIGPIGSGKSSLFYAILGEMNRLNGEINMNGSSISYVSQSAWIFSDTIRANILLDKTFNKERYSNILRACCLDVDINAFGPSSDLTVIGEKGMTLSGGQKTRISLARALYMDADIYLLDDPLASVDNRVAEEIYSRCIGPDGFLNKKTRLLITHQTKYLSNSDKILYFCDGQIQSQGFYNELQMKHRIIDRIDEKNSSEISQLSEMLNTEQSSIDTRSIIDDEILTQGSVSWSVWRHLLIDSPIGWFGLCLLIILLTFGQIFYDSSNIILRIWLKQISTDQQFQSVFFYIYIIITLSTLLVAFLRSDYFFHVFLIGTNHLHNTMLNRLINTSVRFFETNPSGRILNRAGRDQYIIDEILPITLFDSTQSLLMTIGSLFIIIILNPWTLSILIPFIIISLLLRHVYVRSNYQLKRLENITRNPIYTLFSSSLDGLITIRALKLQQYFLNEFLNRIDANTRAYINMISVSQWFGIVLDLLNNIFSVGTILLTIVFKDVLNHSLIILLLMYSIIIKGYFQWGLRQAIEAQLLMTSTERIEEYTQLPYEEDSGGQIGLVKVSPYWPTHGSIEFRNYSLRYRVGLDPALKCLNFRIEPGEKIGIIGRTGAGKSSLFQGLLRLIDRSSVTGQILIDGIDISQLTLAHLRSHLSIIPQQPILFSGTIRYNLDPFNQYTDEECWMALEVVQLKKLVMNHSDGLLLLLTGSSFNLSTGQCQLICAARAFLKKSKILLIDEATANVDPETDSLIQKVLTEKFQDRTVLTIAHRLNSVVRSDRILVKD